LRRRLVFAARRGCSRVFDAGRLESRRRGRQLFWAYRVRAQLGSNFALDLALSLTDREPPILQCVPFVGFDERSGV
jgi:hypothetical protein